MFSLLQSKDRGHKDFKSSGHKRQWKNCLLTILKIFLKETQGIDDLSLSCDQILVINGPAELNALSASTDVGGKVFMYDIFEIPSSFSQKSTIFDQH